MPTLEQNAFIRELLRPLPGGVVVELGANVGEEEHWIRESFGGPVFYVFVEPDLENRDIILSLPHPGPWVPWVLYWGAIADTHGTREFHYSRDRVSGERVSGSLRKPTGHLKQYPNTYFVSRGPVRIFTLDEIFELERLSKIDLLWCDIQGAENLMIAGGQKALQHTRYLVMEAGTVELYEGESLRPELIAMLPGWKVLREFEDNVVMQNLNFSEVA